MAPSILFALTLPLLPAAPVLLPAVLPALTLALLPRSPLRSLAGSAVLAVLPDGGQRVARRNAWSGMSADSARGRAQREADRALDAAHARAHARARATVAPEVRPLSQVADLR